MRFLEVCPQFLDFLEVPFLHLADLPSEGDQQSVDAAGGVGRGPGRAGLGAQPLDGSAELRWL